MANFFKRNLLAKITCLVLSFALWMYITTVENPIKRKTFRNIPVTFSNLDQLRSKELVIAPGQKITADVTLEGPFSNLLGLRENDISLTMDFYGKPLKVGKNLVTITTNVIGGVTTRGVVEKEIILEPLVSKQFTVKPQLKLETTDPSLYAPPATMDTLVLVSGPKSLVESVANVISQDTIKGLNSNTDRLVKLIPVDKDGKEIIEGVTLDKNYATAKINVYPTKTVDVVAKVSGKLNDGLTLKSSSASPSQVKIAAPKAILDSITQLETEPVPLEKVTLTQVAFPVKIAHAKEVIILGDDMTPREDTISVNFDVETKPSRQITKDVAISGTAKGQTVTFESAKSVTIQVSGEKTKLDALDAASISAQIDVTNLSVGKHEVEVKVVLPSDFTLISVTPQKVTVIVTP